MIICFCLFTKICPGCYNSWVGTSRLQQGTQFGTSKSQPHHNNGIALLVQNILCDCSLSMQTREIWLYTSSFDSAGRITDPCSGDSGGPLFIDRDGHWELVGVLKVS